MTSTLARGAGLSPGEPVRPLRALAASPALIVLLLGGLALRITIAYVLFPSAGFLGDMRTFGRWAIGLGEYGPAGFYVNTSADYPPAYLYALWPIGAAAQAIGESAEHALDVAIAHIKIPPMLLDLVVAYVIYRLVIGWAWPGRRAATLALVAAALYLFNPVTFYDSALWGQADAAGALVLLLGAAALIRGNSEGAAAFAVMAALVKPQYGVVLFPLVGVMLLKRHLMRPGSGPRHRPWAPASLAAWLDRERGPLRLLTSAVVAGATFFALALPFGMGPIEYIRRMSDTAGLYEFVTANAYNIWVFAGSGGVDPMVAGMNWAPDNIPFLGPLPALVIGATLLAAGFLWALVRAAARDDRWTLLVAITVLVIFFFLLPTRVHERYLVPVFGILPVLAVAQRRWALGLVLLSLATLINLHAVQTMAKATTEEISSLPFAGEARTTLWIAASALTHGLVALWAAWQLRPALTTTPDAFEQEARGPTIVAGRPS